MEKNKIIRIIAIIFGSTFLIFSYIDIRNTNQNEVKFEQKIDSLSTSFSNKRKSDSLFFAKIGNSLKPYNLKIQGDSVIPTTIIFVDKYSTNVKSENQKGGQIAGTIINH